MKRLIGLTGKTGAGKSTVSAYLKEMGAYIIDGDIVAREVLLSDKSLLEKLSEAFGADINENGSLNRRLLAKRAFATAEGTAMLNSIMHPAINNSIEQIAKVAFEKFDTVVVDAAAIIESGFADKCDILLVAFAPLEIRKQRIMERDNLSEEDALVRINGQKSDGFYNKRATYIINCYEPYSYKEQLQAIKKELF